MSPTRLQTQAVEKFSCLGADCPDTCCKGWGMQLTTETVAKYRAEAPELLEAVTSGEAEFIMKRDPVSDQCVKFDQGWCGIHRAYGEEFLGDACHFFPRITRALGTTVITSAALSCPETARLMLYTDDGLALGPRSEMRVPYSLRNYLPAEISDEQALVIHAAFLALVGDETVSAGQGLMRVSAVARAIEMQPMNAWADAVPLYAMMADSRIPAAEDAPADLFNLVHALRGLVMASPAPRARLTDRITAIADALGMTFDVAGGLSLAPDASERGVRVLAHLRAQSAALEPVMRRYVQAQLSQALFPFAGFGGTLSERVTIMGVRFAQTRLLLATLPTTPSEAELIGVIQTLSRFNDHLADPTLSLQIFQETGWIRESRLRAIVSF